MAQTFRIATSSKIDGFAIIGEKSKVTEELFYQLLTSKVKEITEKEPERFDELLEDVKNNLLFKGVIIIDTCFEIKGKA